MRNRLCKVRPLASKNFANESPPIRPSTSSSRKALLAASAGWAATRYQDLSLFASVLDLVRRNYVEPVDDHELMESALQGRNLVGIDVVELAPIDGMEGWDFTAAQVVYRLMALG